MKYLKVLIVALAVVMLVQTSVTAVKASGNTLTTTKDSKPGQVLLHTQDGALYLGTETVPGGATDTATRSGIRRGQGILQNINIQIPEGFAKDFGGLLNGVLSFVMVIAALLVFFYLIWAAFDWITSGGDKGATEKARQKIIAAIVGLVVIAASYALLTLALNFLGFANLNDVFDKAGTIEGHSNTSGARRGTSDLDELNATPSATPDLN